MNRQGVINGMAIEIWNQVSDKPFTRVPRPAVSAARDLVKLYENINGGRSIESIASAVGAMDPGREMVFAAMLNRRSGSATFKHKGRVIPGIKVPVFSVSWNKEERELTWDGSSEDEGGPRNNPHKRSLTETRDILASLPADQRCHPSCQGWEIFRVDRDPGLEVEVCDDCNRERPKSQRLTDDDVAQLPEAQLALAKEFEREDEAEREEVEGAVREIHGGKVVPRVNPSGRFYAFRYEGGWRTKPKEYWGPFDSKADADRAVRDDIAKYGDSGRHAVKQLTDAQFHDLWHGHGERRGLPPGVAMSNPRRRNTIEEDLGINPRGRRR